MLKVAVLPFNTGEGAKPQLGRQISGFVADQVRGNSEAEIQSVSFLTQILQNGVNRTAYVNISDGLMEADQLKELFGQSDVDLAMDGYLALNGDSHELTVRYTNKDGQPGEPEVIAFKESEVFGVLGKVTADLASRAKVQLPGEMSGGKLDFGTSNPTCFLKFLEGYDALNYIQQAEGMVAEEFNPEPPMNVLLEAVELDKDFEGPYQVLVGLCRACLNFRIGNFEMVERTLNRAAELVPDEFAAYFALGELYQAGGVPNKAVDFFEKASALNPDDPGILNRLGNAQMQVGMPVNAERTFRRALELEGDDKPSLDFLVGVLNATNRSHEVPALWKTQMASDPKNPEWATKYALSLYQSGNESEGQAAFESALESLDDPVLAKRYYAPILVQKGELDRAMDFYEDCLDVAPNEIPLLLEYAQTLQAADREFEIPEVLNTVLKSNPDPNTRANTQAWLLELEQPKRVAGVSAAQQKLDAGDAEGAIKEVKPLRNWLADYWKLWAVLASAQNRLGAYEEAEESAKRLVEMFPGCEPAYGELREALNGQGKHEEAWQLMQFAFSQNSQSFGLFVNLGLAAKRAGHTEEAKGITDQIKEVLKENPEAQEQLSEILTELQS